MIKNLKLSYEDAVVETQYELDMRIRNSPKIVHEHMNVLASTRGKLIRARSLLTCALDAENKVARNAVLFAAAIELLHLATLIHDDVIDDADLRRGKPTLQKLYGKKTAVICGDYLLCTALTALTEIPSRKDYKEFQISNYAAKICKGEIFQEMNNSNLNISSLTYFKIIRNKTAALFEASFHIGAYLSEEAVDSKRTYEMLGRYIGMIFQLRDDCLDYEADEKTAKKPIMSDFVHGVITLPLIYSLKSHPATDFSKFVDKEKVAKEVKDFVNSSGGVIFTKKVSEKYYKKGLLLIDKLTLPEYKSEKLLRLIKTAHLGS